MGLGPFGGTEEGRLFAVPEAIDDGAVGLPALFHELTEGARFFKLGAGAGEGIFRAVDPGVVMIAADDPLIGKFGAGNFGDDVVEGLAVPVEGDGEMGLRL